MNNVVPKENQIEIGKALEAHVALMKEVLSSSPDVNEVSAIERFLMENDVIRINAYIEKISNFELTFDDIDKMESESDDMSANMELDKVE